MGSFSMFAGGRHLADLEGQVAAIGRALAVIEFNLDGTIRKANENFLNVVGYTLAEIRGKHHGLFVEPAERESAEYRAFWARLARGEYVRGEFRRLARGGREIWLQASYNPIFDRLGRPFKVVKYATDITATMERRANGEGQLAAIDKAPAIVEQVEALNGLISRYKLASGTSEWVAGGGVGRLAGERRAAGRPWPQGRVA